MPWNPREPEPWQGAPYRLVVRTMPADLETQLKAHGCTVSRLPENQRAVQPPTETVRRHVGSLLPGQPVSFKVRLPDGFCFKYTRHPGVSDMIEEWEEGESELYS